MGFMNTITTVYGQVIDGEAMVTVESDANEPMDYDASTFMDLIEAGVRALIHAFRLTHGHLPEIDAIARWIEDFTATARKAVEPLVVHREDFKGMDGVDLVNFI